MNINLCEILKGHEGEIFYSSIFGNVKLIMVKDDVEDCGDTIFTESDCSNEVIPFSSKGEFFMQEEALGCTLFPSKDQRDWNKWIEEQNPKIPKTWSELIEVRCYIGMGVNIDYTTQDTKTMLECGGTPIEKSALALLKIHQIIEVGYGGNVTKEEWLNDGDVYVIGFDGTEFRVFCNPSMVHTLAFHTQEQAKEFLLYPENIELLNDYFMI